MKLLNSNIDSKKRIVCSSAGNHAQSIAYLSKEKNIQADIFLPNTTPQQKIDKIKYFSNPDLCNLHFVGNIFDECLYASKIFSEKNDSIYIHPFDDEDIIAGQGTIGYEIENSPIDFNIIISSIGGGGLISGISSYLKNNILDYHKYKIYGVESENNNSMGKSVKNNKIITLKNDDFFVDGSAVKKPGLLTFKICKKYVDNFLVVSNNRVCSDLVDLYQKDGIIAELAGAMSISALDKIKNEIEGKTICCIISGGNNDILRMSEIYNRKLIHEQKLHYYLVKFHQRSGELKKFICNVLDKDDDIIRFEYLKKNNREFGNVLVGIQTSNCNYIDKQLKLNNFKNFKLTDQDILHKYIL